MDVLERSFFIHNVRPFRQHVGEKLYDKILNLCTIGNMLGHSVKPLRLNPEKLEISIAVDYNYYILVIKAVKDKVEFNKMMTNSGRHHFIEMWTANDISASIDKVINTYLK